MILSLFRVLRKDIHPRFRKSILSVRRFDLKGRSSQVTCFTYLHSLILEILNHSYVLRVQSPVKSRYLRTGIVSSQLLSEKETGFVVIKKGLLKISGKPALTVEIPIRYSLAQSIHLCTLTSPFGSPLFFVASS